MGASPEPDANGRPDEGARDTFIEVSDPQVLLRLSGPNGSHLRSVAAELDLHVGLRGNKVLIKGEPENVAFARRVIEDLVDVLERGTRLTDVEFGRAVKTLRNHPEMRLRELFDEVVLVATNRKRIAPKGVAQHAYIRAIREYDVVFGIGPAGTGKTYLAMAMAVKALLAKQVKRIILARPAVEAGEKLGFLPGDLAEKVNPYLRPLYDALHDMMDIDKAQSLIGQGTIEVAPLAFMRGRTLNDSFVILDEAQNTTAEQMKMFLTRLGYDSQAVITGDATQIDLPEGRRSGLHDAAALLKHVEGIKMCFFTDVDVVRHPLVQRIVRAYDGRDERRNIKRFDQDASTPQDDNAGDDDAS